MQRKGGRIAALVLTAIGVAVVLIAVLAFGLTKTSNGETTLDWISILTAICGVAIVGGGLSNVVRHG
jgi:hypothetical protein